MDESALVTALSRGDREALSSAYRKYAGRLQAYAWRLLGDTEAVDAVVQDTFDQVGWHADELRDPHRLRAWLYAIVRLECRRRVRTLPHQAGGELRPLEADGIDPAAATRSAYAVELVRTAMATLTSREHEVVELSVRHGLAAAEIGAVLSISPTRAYDQAKQARAHLEDAVDALIAVSDGRCRLLHSLSGWSGPLSRHRIRRVVEHVADCGACRALRRELPSGANLLAKYASLPFVNASTWLALRATPDWEPRWSRSTGFPQPPVNRTRRVLVATTALAAAIGLAGGALRLTGGPPAGATAQQTPLTSASSSPDATATPSAAGSASPSASISPTGSVTGSPAVVPILPGSPSPGGPAGEQPQREPTSSPASSPSPTIVRPPLTVGAAESATCGDKGRFVLSVTVAADADLRSATLTWRAGDTRVATMPVDQATAYTEVWSAKPRAPITWWVTVTSADGRSASTTAVTTPNPCV